MKVTIEPIVIGAFGTISKGLLKGLEDLEVGGRDYSHDSIADNGKNPETPPGQLEEAFCHSNSNEKPSANTDEKNSKGVNNNNNNNNIDKCSPFSRNSQYNFLILNVFNQTFKPNFSSRFVGCSKKRKKAKRKFLIFEIINEGWYPINQIN